jgi:hypothetical protein
MEKKSTTPATAARVTFTVEVACPFCRYYNRYHDLTSVHGNMKRVIEGKKDTYTLDAKCQQCEKRFSIVKHVY